MKTITAAEFKARCLRIIGQMKKDGEAVTITRRGRPVAVLSPVPPTEASRSFIGAMRGSVLAYDDPFAPAADPDEWMEAR